MVVAAFGYAVNAGLESMLTWLSFPVFALSFSVRPEWIIAGFILLGKTVGNGSNAGMCYPDSAPIGPSLHFSEDSTTTLCGRGSEASADGVVSVP
ncbi:hypothetical protein Nepgr_023965 [Nepenthes gracilis]|uniref:Uncharacterized protein n=1 Tax=Nepenthes gracilis TaxID=150966 RepID=A0AAD3XY70_NEPGR|nr:hypothetical protein Nepgr_023965 [Nepenthes gracilis]